MQQFSFINFQAFGGQATKKGGAGTIYFEVELLSTNFLADILLITRYEQNYIWIYGISYFAGYNGRSSHISMSVSVKELLEVVNILMAVQQSCFDLVVFNCT